MTTDVYCLKKTVTGGSYIGAKRSIKVRWIKYRWFLLHMHGMPSNCKLTLPLYSQPGFESKLLEEYTPNSCNKKTNSTAYKLNPQLKNMIVASRCNTTKPFTTNRH